MIVGASAACRPPGASTEVRGNSMDREQSWGAGRHLFCDADHGRVSLFLFSFMKDIGPAAKSKDVAQQSDHDNSRKRSAFSFPPAQEHPFRRRFLHCTNGG